MEADSVSVLNLLSQRPKRWSPALGRWSDLQGVICIFGLEFEDLELGGLAHHIGRSSRRAARACRTVRTAEMMLQATF